MHSYAWWHGCCSCLEWTDRTKRELDRLPRYLENSRGGNPMNVLHEHLKPDFENLDYEIKIICMYCKKIRNEQYEWAEQACRDGSEASVLYSHTACPECYRKALWAITRELAGFYGNQEQGSGQQIQRAI